MNDDLYKSQSKDTLKEALIDLLKNKDLNDIRIQQLVSSVGLCRSTFYLYYEDIHALYEAAVIETLQPVEQLSKQPLAPLSFMSSIYEIVDSSNRCFAVLLSNTKHPYFYCKFKTYITTGLCIHCKNNVQYCLVQIISSAIIELIQTWLTQPYPVSNLDLMKVTQQLLQPLNQCQSAESYNNLNIA